MKRARFREAQQVSNLADRHLAFAQVSHGELAAHLIEKFVV
jgi:hypothetical protein